MSAFKEIAIIGGMVTGAVALAFGLAAGVGHNQYGTPGQESLHQRSAENAVTSAGFTNPHVEKYDGGYCNKYAKITSLEGKSLLSDQSIVGKYSNPAKRAAT